MNRIKELRLKSSLKQIELCKMVGITQGALSGWENNKFEPDNGSLKKLADIFDVSVDYLLGREDKQKSPLDKELEGIDFALFGEVKELTEGEKEDILSYIRFKKSQRK